MISYDNAGTFILVVWTRQLSGLLFSFSVNLIIKLNIFIWCNTRNLNVCVKALVLESLERQFIETTLNLV